MYYTSLVFLLTVAFAVAIQEPTDRSQRPIMNNPNLGPIIPLPDEPTSSGPADVDTVILSDVLGRDRSINIFAGFTRDISSITKRLEDSSQNTTILAPVNSAITALPRKPWEDPEDYDNIGADAYEGAEGEARAHKNMRRFVEAHIVPASPFKEGEKMKTLAGGKVWWETRDGKRMIQPGNIEVLSVASQVYNGQVWILKGVRNYAQDSDI